MKKATKKKTSVKVKNTVDEQKNGRDPKTGRFMAGNQFALKWPEERALQLSKELLEWMKESQSNFWLQDFLLEKDLYPDLVSELAKRYPPFADDIARAKAIQASRITKFSLMNQLNSGMAQWVLAAVHGIHNVQKTETELKSTQPIIVNIDSDDAKG